MWKSVVILFSFSCVVYSFNLETVNYVRHRGPSSSSMFGFSVATHRERGNSWILVGAPNAQNQQPGVERGGAVYRCSIDNDSSCQEVPFDAKGHNIDTQGRAIDHKSGQWFGATLHSSGEDGPIVACAPRYVYYASKLDRRDPVGTCWVARGDFSSFSEYSPCRTAFFGYHRQGSCQAGFSAAISNDGKRLFVGGPGSWYWQGQVYSIDAHATFPFPSPGKFGGAFGSGQVIQQSLETRPAVISTRGGNERDDNSYMGYSATVGDFTGEGVQGVAVGMPRGNNLYGKIVLFTWNLTNHQNITGSQLGAYFGYSLACGDIDGDKSDDLIIGAPLHTEANNEGKYEVGRIYIVYQGRDPLRRYRRLNTLDGFNSKGRFGLSVASLGDINLDGYGDFAVGAPYDGPNERGAVYIYHGSPNIKENKYSQVIYAEDISEPGLPVATFGFSLDGGLDLDNNDYPDMAVGSYLSNEAFFFRARPVVKIDAGVKFMTTNKQIILDEKNCTLLNRQAVPCTSIDVCMKFSGVGVPHNIELDVQYVLDSKKPKNPRMFFLSNENRNVLNESIILQKDDRQICRQKIVYIRNDIRDKLTPLEVEVRYSKREAHSFQQTGRNPRSVLLPILDMNSELVRKDSISVHKNCGSDNICIPNLGLSVKSNVEKYLLGSKEKLEFDITVQNTGEDSFESTFDIQLPPGVDFNKIEHINKTEVRILCTSIENNTIRCDIGNPLPAGKIARFKFIMTPYHKEGMKPSYDFHMVANSTNPEVAASMKDNVKDLSILIWVDSSLDTSGVSKPNEISYNASQYTSDEIKTESDIGSQVIHVYMLKNEGPSNINEAEIVILWPYATLGDEDLLYLLEQPHTLGNVKCEPTTVNPKKYELESWKKAEFLKSFSSESSFTEQMGGVLIEEGTVIRGSLPGEKTTKVEYDYDQTGDASFVHQQRGKQAGGSDVASTVVHVDEDKGSGSTVHVEHTSWSNRSSTTGPVTHTYTRNFTRISGGEAGAGAGGMQGERRTEYGGGGVNVRITETHKSHGESGGAEHSESGSGIITESGGRTQTGSRFGGEGGRTFTQESRHGGGYRQETSEEARGQAHRQQGGHTYQMAQEIAARKQEAEAKRQEMEAGRSAADIRGLEEARRQDEIRRQSEIRRLEEARRVEEARKDEIRRQQETRRQEEEARRREEITRQNEIRRQEETIRRDEARREEEARRRDEARRHEEARRQEEARIQHEVRRQEEARRLEESRRTGETTEGQYPGSKPQINNHFVWNGVDRRGGEHRQTGGEIHNEENYDTSQTYPDHYGVNYSEEEYYGADDLGNSGIHTSATGDYAGGAGGHRGEASHERGQAGGHNYSHTTQFSHGGRNEQFEQDYAKHGLGAAALDHGFKTTGLDLGTLGQDQLSGHAQGGGYGQGGHIEGGHAQGSHIEGGYAQGGHIEGGYSQGGHVESGYTQGGHSQVGHAQAGHSQSGHSQSWHTSWSSESPGRDNVATDKPNYENRFVGRRKRQVPLQEFDLSCNSAKCLVIKCTVGAMEKDQVAIIALRSRVAIRTLRNITSKTAVRSKMQARISKYPYIGTPIEQQMETKEIVTNVNSLETDPKLNIVPLWVVVLSAVAGTIILLLLIYLLYKCGFFRRNRPSDAPERQPLNRNGYYQNGDAAL